MEMSNRGSVLSGDLRDRNQINSDNKTITDTSKSAKSVKSSNKKKSDVSFTTILSSIEREINDLIQEISIRAQKNKLMSIAESVKLLGKKYASESKEANASGVINTYASKDSNVGTYIRSNSVCFEDYNKLREDFEIVKKNSDNEIKRLKEEISNLQNKLNNNSMMLDIEGKLQKKDEIINKLNGKVDQMSYLFSEEKVKNNQLVIQTRNLEEALRTLNSEYNSISQKYGKLQNETETLERTIADLRKNNQDNKYNFETLIKANNELKSKLIESENTLKLHTEDLKSLLKKHAFQQKYLEEVESKNKQLSADLSYKEERLKALRHMNTKLEQKSNQIVKKWEAFKLYEEKSNELSQNSQRMAEMIEELNRRLNQESYEKDTYRRDIDTVVGERNKLLADYDELKKQLYTLRSANEELMSKNTELENKFKRSLDQRTGGESTTSSLAKDRMMGKTYHSSTLNNMNLSTNSKQDVYSQVS